MFMKLFPMVGLTVVASVSWAGPPSGHYSEDGRFVPPNDPNEPRVMATEGRGSQLMEAYCYRNGAIDKKMKAVQGACKPVSADEGEAKPEYYGYELIEGKVQCFRVYFKPKTGWSSESICPTNYDFLPDPKACAVAPDRMTLVGNGCKATQSPGESTALMLRLNEDWKLRTQYHCAFSSPWSKLLGPGGKPQLCGRKVHCEPKAEAVNFVKKFDANCRMEPNGAGVCDDSADAVSCMVASAKVNERKPASKSSVTKKVQPGGAGSAR